MVRSSLVLSAKEWAEGQLAVAGHVLSPGARRTIDGLLSDQVYDAAASFTLEYVIEAGQLSSSAREEAEILLQNGEFGRSTEWARELLAK